MRHDKLAIVRGAVSASACCLLLLAPAKASAQAVFGQIVGTVTDSTGAAIPGATVVVSDPSKGTSVTYTSNSAGEFSAAHLIPDTYDVKVSATGFQAFEQKGIPVYADTTPSMKAVLAVGSSTTVIEVNADQVAQLKTDKTDVATVFNAEEIGTLPIPDHNFANLQLLLPGAVQLGWAHAASENPQGSKQIQIDGQAFGGVNYTLDGTDNQDAILGIIVINPNYESMSEAKIATQNFDAEFGKAVASVQTVQTKSGSNNFHGTIFDNRESNANLARDPFGGVAKGQAYPSGLKNQFGGSIGGPIFKDKAFFFADYQGVRQKVGSSGTGSIPTILALKSCTGAANASNGQPGCDFSDYLNKGLQQGGTNHQIYNNSGGSPIAYANNIIPLNQLSPQAVNLFKLLLANNIVPTSDQLFSNYAGVGKGLFNSDQFDVRLDSNLNQRTHAFVRYSRFTDTLSGASLFGPAGGPGLGIAGFGGISLGKDVSLATGADIALSAKWITDVRFGYFSYGITTRKNDSGNTNLPFIGENVSGATPNLQAPINFGAPDIQIADATQNDLKGVATTQNGGPQFGSGLNEGHCNCPLKEKEDQFQLANNWTRTLGTHAIKFGVDLRYARNLRVPSDADRTGVNNFGNNPTSNGATGGLGFATFALGDVTAFNRYTSTSVAETDAKEFQARDFFYAQDTWRFTPKLTLNYGLRYEYYGPERVNRPGNGALLNLDTGYINVAGTGAQGLNLGVQAAKFPLNPRLGVAYQFNDKTVIRAGYGRSFDLGVFGSTFGHVVTQNIPVLANQSLSGTTGPTSYAFNLSDPNNLAVPGVGKPANASSPLIAFQSPAISNSGQIAINATIPNTGGATIGSSVNVKARPFTERLTTIDAWNLTVQRSLTPTVSIEIAYVGNKGTHTLSDGDGNNTNPNEPGIFLPAQYSSIKSGGTPIALHFDNLPADQAAITAFCTSSPGSCSQGVPTSGTYQGATNNSTLLRRFNGGSLPACGGPCGLTQDISYYGDDQDTHYNAIQTKFTKTMKNGLSMNLNYAYQVGTDTASSYATFDKQSVIGNDSNIRRSAFTAYGLYQLPFGGGKMFNAGRVGNAVLGGFEFSPVVQWQSGLPYSLSYSSCGQVISSAAPCQPNGSVSGLPVTGIQGTPTAGGGGVHYFTPVALGTNGFSAPGLDQIGNIKRNSAFGPHLFNSDMAISKNINFHERYQAQIRMDAFNAFNHINFGNPNGNIESGGQITQGPYPASTSGTTNPRQLQFTIHLKF